MTIAVNLVPTSTSKVRNGNWHRAVLDRYCTQLYRATPLGKVVDIHIQWKTILQTIYKSVIHNIVHTSVSTNLCCHDLGMRSYGVLVLLHKLLANLIRYATVAVEVFNIYISNGILAQQN